MAGKYYTLTRNLSKCHIFEFDPNELRLDSTIGVKCKLERLSKINGEPEADETTYAKINGGFFNMNGSTEFLGAYVDDGLYYNPPEQAYPTLVFWKDSKTFDYNPLPDTPTLVKYQREAQFAIGVPWMLVIDGKANYLYSKQQLINWFIHPYQRNPRTLIGQKYDGTIVWVVVEGRSVTSKGFTIDHSSALMLELGCRIAANLDGGGSSEMIINGQIKNKLSGGCERAIGTAIVCYAKKKTSTSTPTTDYNAQPTNISTLDSVGYITYQGNINVRTAPNLNSTILGTLPKGTKVTVNGKYGNWFRIQYGTGNAWVTTYVSMTNTSEASRTYGTTTDALNLRPDPSTKKSRLALIPKGTKIPIQGSTNGWYKTTYKNKTGWVCGQWVKL